MTEQKETHQSNFAVQCIIWEGIPIEVRYCASWLKSAGLDLVHLEIESDNRQPLPITDTGYRSEYSIDTEVGSLDEAVTYVEAWLAEASQSKAWKRYCEDQRQGCLF